jgi:8-oxo-dGTP pyrophosphatase MutT (NUDIX family)
VDKGAAMTGAYAFLHVPPEKTMREVAHKLFEEEVGLRIEAGSWNYTPIPLKNAAEVSFTLFKGKKTVFSDVRIIGRYESEDSCKIEVQASINGLSPAVREFYVVEECNTERSMVV